MLNFTGCDYGNGVLEDGDRPLAGHRHKGTSILRST